MNNDELRRALELLESARDALKLGDVAPHIKNSVARTLIEGAMRHLEKVA